MGNTKKFRKIRDKLLSAQQNKCYYCERDLQRPEEGVNIRAFIPNLATLDHVVPRAMGGKHAMNLVVACQVCNLRKGNKETL